MSPVEVRTLGQFVTLNRSRKNVYFFFGKCLAVSLQTNAGRERKYVQCYNQR